MQEMKMQAKHQLRIPQLNLVWNESTLKNSNTELVTFHL